MNSKKVVSNMFWRFAERCGAQGVNFIVSIVLARLVSPADYGSISLVTVFIAIMQVFVDSGLGNSLIQKKNADDLDFSTVFFVNLGMCVDLYIITFILAPAVANFYGDNVLTSVIRVLGLTILISGIKNIQQAYVSRNMLFKRFFFSTLGGTLFSAAVGIVMAYLDFGIWALVCQQLLNTLIDTMILWITVRWRPRMQFSIDRLKGLFSFGWKLLISSLLETVYNNLRSLIIGKFYSTSDLAYYNKGNQFPVLMVSNVNAAIDSVLLPSMSSAQDEKDRLKSMIRRSIKISSYIIWPMMIGLAVSAKPLILFLLTDKWSSCIPFLQIFCINYAFWPIHTANLNAIKAVGRSDIFLRAEILKKIIGIISILISIRFGVFAIAIAFTITSPISAMINAAPNKKLFGYSIREQMSDLLPAIICSAVMGISIWPIQLLKLAPIVILLLQVIIGMCVYYAESKLFKLESYIYIESMIKSVLKKKEIK